MKNTGRMNVARTSRLSRCSSTRRLDSKWGAPDCRSALDLLGQGASAGPLRVLRRVSETPWRIRLTLCRVIRRQIIVI